MVYCYFNKEFTNTYACEYEISNSELLIDVDLGNATSEMLHDMFNKKETIIYAQTITIVDEKTKFYIKTFTAFECHFQTITGHPFIRTKKSYKAKSYFKAKNVADLEKLDLTTTIDNATFYHECLDVYSINTTKHIETNNDFTKTIITLNTNENAVDDLQVKKDNIKNAQIVSDWISINDQRNIKIEYQNKLNLNFKKCIKLLDLYAYKDFISCMFNLYSSTNTPIYNIKFKYQNSTYEFHYTNLLYSPTHKLNINKIVNCKIKDFLNSFLNNTSINDLNTNLLNPFKEKGNQYAEDVFLINYRFIERHLKKHNPQNWLQLLIRKNKELVKLLNIKYNSKLYLFIETLRNHYVHEGYYIDKNKLKLKGAQGKNKIVTNEIIINFSRLTKALTYKIMLNDILSLNILDENIITII